MISGNTSMQIYVARGGKSQWPYSSPVIKEMIGRGGLQLALTGITLSLLQIIVIIGLIGFGITPTSARAAAPVGEAPVPQDSQGRTETRRRADKRYQWLLLTSGKAYQQVGSRSERWDAPVESLLTKSSRLRTYYAPDSWEVNDQIRQIAREIQASGCDDPFIRFLCFWYTRQGDRTEQETGFLQEMGAGIVARGYPPIRQFYGILRAAEATFKTAGPNRDEAVAKARKFLETASRNLQEVIKDKTVPPAELYEACDEFLEGSYRIVGKRQEAFDQIDAMFEAGSPQSVTRYQIRGKFYTQYAWDARGTDYAPKVKREWWKQMRERLELAEQSLLRAWQMDPADSLTATLMLGVELGQGKGRDVMELWFKRAMQANPDDAGACSAKLYYLEPKWYGSAEEMLRFGRACFETRNWENGISFTLISAHQNLSAYEKNPNDYYQKRGVWEDIDMVCREYLKTYPDARVRRTWYAHFALTCQQWQAANEQFNLLSDRAYVEEFGGRAEYYRMRGFVKSKLSDYDGAIAENTLAIEIDPKNVAAYVDRALAHSKKHDYDRDIEDCTKAIEINPKYAAAYTERGWAKLKKEDYNGCVVDFTRAIQLNHDDYVAYRNRGWAKFKIGDYDGAIADATRVVRFDPKDKYGYGTRAWARHGKGDNTGAVEDCQKAIELSKPDSWAAAQYQGLMDFANGKYKEAITSWENAIERNANVKGDLEPWIERAKAKLNK